MEIKYSIWFVLVFAIVGCRKVPNNCTADNLPQAQATPPDMVFVWGDGSIPSFYMGVSEECNINHQIYRNWQKMVYLDYPEAYKATEPKNRDVSHLLQFNDPYYAYYQNHEAFAYYPVVGLSWIQAMDYLQWKGDRLNEKILFEIGVHVEEDLLQQTNDQSFNTEAYLSGQYEGMVKRDLRDEAPNGTTRKVRYSDGILFATPRLPTEAEWEYVLATQPAKPINAKTYRNPFSKEALFPFGKDYYTFIYGKKQGLEFYEYLEQGYPYHIKYDTVPKTPDRLTGAADYDLKAAGIANLEGNVPEWLMDEYTEKPEYTTLNFENYFTKYCAPLLNDTLLYDAEGYMHKKDSLGKMYFNIFGIPSKKEGSKPLYFTNFNITVRRIIGHKKAYYDSTKYKIRPNNYNLCYTNDTTQPKYNHIPFKDYKIVEKSRYGTHGYWGQCLEYFSYISLQKDSIGYYTMQPVYDVVNLNNRKKYRVVKGGSWKSPDGYIRRKMREDSASSNVGFRAVITYSGIPVINKKYKVKWK